MKTKILLATALCMGGAVALTAQNLVVNGDFEATEYVDELDGSTHQVYTWNRSTGESDYGYFTVYIPGWDRRTTEEGTLMPINYDYETILAEDPESNPEPEDLYNAPYMNKWYVYAGLVYQVDMPEYNENSFYYVDIRRYQDDGWWGGASGISQTINVEPATKYHISFQCMWPVLEDIRGGFGTTQRNPSMDRKVEVTDVSDGLAIYTYSIPEDAEQQPWTLVEGEFTTGDATSQIVLWATMLANTDIDDDKGGQNKGTAFCLDDIKIWKDGTSPDDPNAVAEVLADNVQVLSADGFIRIQGAEAGDVLSVYNMAGQQVVNTVVTSADFTVDTQLAGGIYVVKVNDAARKVAL